MRFSAFSVSLLFACLSLATGCLGESSTTAEHDQITVNGNESLIAGAVTFTTDLDVGCSGNRGAPLSVSADAVVDMTGHDINICGSLLVGAAQVRNVDTITLTGEGALHVDGGTLTDVTAIIVPADDAGGVVTATIDLESANLHFSAAASGGIYVADNRGLRMTVKGGTLDFAAQFPGDLSDEDFEDPNFDLFEAIPDQTSTIQHAFVSISGTRIVINRYLAWLVKESSSVSLNAVTFDTGGKRAIVWIGDGFDGTPTEIPTAFTLTNSTLEHIRLEAMFHRVLYDGNTVTDCAIFAETNDLDATQTFTDNLLDDVWFGDERSNHMVNDFSGNTIIARDDLTIRSRYFSPGGETSNGGFLSNDICFTASTEAVTTVTVSGFDTVAGNACNAPSCPSDARAIGVCAGQL
ncbi:MAG: hypothetical protein D6761_01065 [Candidatus Dadabacteria bacterium]|nr:MAG: hypothetical protein D6761_01065 [Candidatus Dadabacteria bacterium]